MLKKFVFLLVMAFALSCSFSVMAESYKTPAQLVDDARAAVKQISAIPSILQGYFMFGKVLR